MNLIIISFAQTSKLAYKGTRLCLWIYVRKSSLVYQVSLKYLRILAEVS